MNREIKFRGQLSHSKQWVVGNLIIAKNGDPYIIPANIFEPDGHHLIIDSDAPFWVIPETVGQFTNLKDKNGREIYEGDLIKFWLAYATTQTHYGGNIPGGSYTEPDEPVFEKVTGEVIFDEERGRWSFSFIGKVPYDYDTNPYMGIEEILPIIERARLCVYEVASLYDMSPYEEYDPFNHPDQSAGENRAFVEILKEKGINSVVELEAELDEMEVIGNVHDNPVKEGI